MKDIAILMPCWKSPELLKISIPSLMKSITTNSEIIVILNEVDQESASFLDEKGIKHIDKSENYGPSAIDFAIPYIKEVGFKYVANVNSDMLFGEGWDSELIKFLKKNKPCTVSCCLVEPLNTKHSVFDKLDFYNPNSHDLFNENIKKGKYVADIISCYYHPILCTVEDYLSVNGYSDNMDEIWVELKGRGLDDDFPYRLYKKNSGNFKFLRSNKAFVYHGVSMNSVKLKVRQPGHTAFKKKNGIEIVDFKKTIGY